MADNNQDLEALSELLRKSRELSEEKYLAEEGYAKRADGTLKAIESQTQKRAAIELKINAELEKALGKDVVIYNKRQAQYEKQLESMNYLIDANRNLVKTSVELDFKQRQQISSLKRSEETANNLRQAQDNLVDNMKKGLVDLGKGMGNFALNLGKGNTSFTSLNPLIDIVANALGSLAKAIPFVGEAIAGGIKASAEASKFILELMDKNIKAFQEISNSGGLVADGMAGVSRQFLESGMSLEGFKKVIKDNSRDLAAFGGTVGEGGDKLTKAIGMITKSSGAYGSAGLELRKLGLTADDIGNQAAAFLQQEIRLGRARNMTEKQLAEGTIKYAQELDALQKITGLSREDVVKQRDELMSDSRFRAATDTMVANGQKEGAEALKAFILTVKDPELKRGIMDLSSGAANTDAARKALVMLGDTVPNIVNQLKETKPGEIGKNLDQVQTELKRGAKQYVETFREAASIMPDTSKLGNYAAIADLLGKQNISYEEALKLQKAQATSNNSLTASAVSAQQNLERLGQEVYKLGDDVMPKAAEAVRSFTKSLLNFVNIAKGMLRTGEVASGPPAPMGETGGGAATGNPNLARQGARARREPDIGKPPTPGPGVNVSSTATTLPATTYPATPTASTTPTTDTTPASAPRTRGVAKTETAAVTPTDVMKLIKFQGDALGNREHFDSLDPYVRRNFMDMIAEYGKPVQINAAMRDMSEQQNLYDKWIENGKLGNPVAPPGSSKHNFGRALDLNSSQVADLATSGLLSKYGFNTIPKDPPHIEMARFGGVFSGPESGYPVMLHGDQETVVTKPQFDEMAEGVKKESVTTAMQDLGSTTTNPADSPSVILKDLFSLMEDKFDTMIDKLSAGNNIQSDLLKYSRV